MEKIKDLENFLTQKNCSKTKFANQIGIAREFLHRIISGKSELSPKIAVKIERATNGEILARNLLPEFFSHQKKAEDSKFDQILLKLKKLDKIERLLEGSLGTQQPDSQHNNIHN